MARVLVVEDNPRLNTLALKVLCGHGHQVEQAADGATGVELALAKHPDVVLMDAHAMPSDRERALEAGCDCVITKPYAIADLLACVERLAARSVPAAAVPAQDGTA
ncbi:MAG: response regulator [Chloroflexi bacterium]|nr:MAG: response regulator [Chloroflexota bacterium]